MIRDDSKMPYGKYEGDLMINVPAHYLIWLYENKRCRDDVKSYIYDNLDVLRKEVKDNG